MAHTKEADRLKQLKITAFEIEVIEGCLIGDGTLSKSGKFYRLRVNHSIKQATYVAWKYDLLKRLCLTEPQFVRQTISVRFGTIGHPELNTLRNKWYNTGSKEIPANVTLTPLQIAIWFMDDGGRQSTSVDFSVHCFSLKSIKILQKSLKSYGIETSLLFDGKGTRIYVRRCSYSLFDKLVKPYMHPCMAYKLP